MLDARTLAALTATGQIDAPTAALLQLATAQGDGGTRTMERALQVIEQRIMGKMGGYFAELTQRVAAEQEGE